MNVDIKTTMKNEKISILGGTSSIFALTVLNNGYIPLFAISALGATNQQIGLINSLPSLVGLFVMIPGAMWINRLESKKTFAAMSTLSMRLMFLFMFLLPFLPIDGKAWILVAFIALMNIPGALANLSWQSLIGDLIPEDRRGGFFSQRNRVLTFAGMLITLFTGSILSLYDKKFALPYQFLFLLAFIFGLLEVYYLMKHIEYKKTKTIMDSRSKKKLISAFSLFKNKPFLFFVLSALLFNFGWQMAWPLFSIYQIKHAHVDAFWLSLFAVANQIAQVVSYKWWGKSADRWGNSMMLFVAAMGMATAPILTVLSTNFVYLTIINLWTGLFVAGTVMLLFNQLLKVSPEDNRTTYLANYNVLLGIIGFIAPQFGVFMLDKLGMFHAMSISTTIRLLGGIAFLVVVFYVERKIKDRTTAIHG